MIVHLHIHRSVYNYIVYSEPNNLTYTWQGR